MMGYIGICFGGELDGQSHSDDRPIFIREKENGFRETYYYESMAARRGTLTGIWRHQSLDIGQVVAHALLAYQQKVLRPDEAVLVKPDTLRRLRDIRTSGGLTLYTPAGPQRPETFAGIPVRLSL